MLDPSAGGVSCIFRFDLEGSLSAAPPDLRQVFSAGAREHVGQGEEAAHLDQMAGAFTALHDPGSFVVAVGVGFSASLSRCYRR